MRPNRSSLAASILSSALFVSLFLTIGVALPANAQRFTLSDSLSPRQNYALDLSWDPVSVRRAMAAMLQGSNESLPPLQGRLSGVEIRLDTRQFDGRRVKIFLRLPVATTTAQGPNGLTLKWQTRGELNDGEIQIGQEALLYEGTLNGSQIGDVFNFFITLENSGNLTSFNFEPEYVLEISP